MAICKGGDRRSSKMLPVSTGSRSVDRRFTLLQYCVDWWIVGGELAPHDQPVSRAPGQTYAVVRRAVDGLTFFKLSYY